MTVGITGGSGVVGTAIVRHLVASGEEPRALSRSETSDTSLALLGARPVRGDLQSDLGPFMDGLRVVYHVAGVNEMCLADPAPMYRANVDGAVAVAAAAKHAGVERFVLTSSAATIGEERGSVGDEGSDHRGWYLSHYERSKHLGELAVLDTLPDAVVVNPSSVQGPGRASGTGKLILDVLNGRLRQLVDTRVSIVDVDDCARGHLLAAERGTPGERYILSGFTLSIGEALALLESVTGRNLDVRFLPGWVASAGASAVQVAARIARRRPPVCREMVRTMLHGHAYDGSKATRELGLDYLGPQPLLERLVAWFGSEGLLEA